jgi:hypothetical protein
MNKPDDAAYSKGMDAFRYGSAESSNPYLKDSPNWCMWRDGYNLMLDIATKPWD